jgi:hypothetical protein
VISNLHHICNIQEKPGDSHRTRIPAFFPVLSAIRTATLISICAIVRDLSLVVDEFEKAILSELTTKLAAELRTV